ncbi:MAG: RNA-directed DNA polymerase [Clostridiaceae bacterium]
MGTTKLTAQNFLNQIITHGFFAEQIPACFSSARLAACISTILPSINCAYSQIKKSNKHTTIPVEISTFKNGISRRILSVPNPEAFLRFVKLVSIHWPEILGYASSENSLSQITYLRSYISDNMIQEINSENIREAHRAKSDFAEGIKDCIRVSLGYQYRLQVDIANCYNSIYTHSIAWAICGKEQAKTYLRTKTPAVLKQVYELADSLDAFMRFQKNNETNGIVVGPFSSRIFSEIILAAIDEKLRKKGFIFRRYVDDYKFYFRTETQAEDGIQQIEKILNEYNLNLNLSKTTIQRFPYEILSNMQEAYAVALKKEGIFGVLNAAAAFHISGEKGAYKYALKYIKKTKLDTKTFDVVFPLLVNVMLLDPKYGKHVITFMKKNRTNINLDKLAIIANNELMQSLSQGLQQESLLFLYLIHDIRLVISAQNIISVLQSHDDFSIIIALDIWKHHKTLVSRTQTEARLINKAIKELITELAGETYFGARWLLLYEIQQHNLLPADKYTPVPLTPFFQALSQNSVSFYES